MARDHRKLRVFHDAHRLTLAIYKHTKGFPKEEWSSGAEVTYPVQLTFELEMLTKSSFAILDGLCQRLVPQLEALVDSVEQLWIEERRAKRVKATKSRARARNTP